MSKLSQKAEGTNYKWLVLSNTTLGVTIASIASSTVLIALPPIFRGMGINPLLPQETDYLIWTIMGYLLVTAVLLLTAGRMGDMYGRVRLYNLGFLIFTIGSILLLLIHGQGNTAAIQLIIYRIIQGVGAAFLFAHSTAILTDVFPPNQRGLALGINQMAFLVGQFIGLVVGGVLASMEWRYVFVLNVPISAGGTIWAYLSLKKEDPPKKKPNLDIIGNLLFAGGLTIFLIGFTYGLLPYGSSPMGWTNPRVFGAMAFGLFLLTVFVFYERKQSDPMFRLELFRIRAFSAGNLAVFLGSLARGGLIFMLLIWLQGVWLPLRGYNFEETPLWAGIFILPLTFGFLVMGPLGGYLSDLYGRRIFSVGGMLICTLGFIGLMFTPVNFPYLLFAFIILILGIGMGLFSSPNTASIMNSVPPEHRGVASGIRSTFITVAIALSITLVFALVSIGLSSSLPETLDDQLMEAGIPASTAQAISELPPTTAMFAAFLGYNPMASLLPQTTVRGLPESSRKNLLSTTFFPKLLIRPFKNGIDLIFVVSAVLSFLAAAASYAIGPERE